jgi:glycosyltransferase involved in cell wall biosynthesis
MAMALPILVTGGAACHEVLDHGLSAWVVAPFSIETVAAALAEAIANPDRADAMGLAARAAFEERFCRERTEGALIESLLA